MSILDDGAQPPPPPAAPAATPPAPNGADWTASLTPELQQFVATKGYKAPADVIVAYQNAEKLVGADKIAVPKDGLFDEASRVKLGVPSDPKDYKIERPALPEGLPYDEKFEAAALKKAHELGLTPRQVQELIKFQAENQGNAFATAQQMQEAAKAETVQTLQKEWGKAYEERVQWAARAAKQIGGDELIEYLNNSGAGDNPHLIRAFAKIGELMREDKMPAGRPGGMTLTPEQARSEANKLMQSDAYRKKDHLEHADTVRRVTQLFELAHPEQ